MNGFLGMMIFSGSLPATRVAVLELDPLFLTAVRAAIAALLALCALLITRQARPTRADLPPLLFVALGVVIGFPLLTALALQHTTSAHSLVYIGSLPLATAGFGVLRGGERPKPAFGLFQASAPCWWALCVEPGERRCLARDALMVGAVLLCGLGYAEGAVLSRRIGGWQVISWALVVALPLTLAATWLAAPAGWPAISGAAWLSLVYVSVFSMWIGLFSGIAAWRRAASPPSDSCSCCSRSSAWRWRAGCCMRPSSR